MQTVTIDTSVSRSKSAHEAIDDALVDRPDRGTTSRSGINASGTPRAGQASSQVRKSVITDVRALCCAV